MITTKYLLFFFFGKAPIFLAFLSLYIKIIVEISARLCDVGINSSEQWNQFSKMQFNFLWNGSSKIQIFTDILYPFCRRLLRLADDTFLKTKYMYHYVYKKIQITETMFKQYLTCIFLSVRANS